MDLYGSILQWLAKAHEHVEGRPSAEICLKLMRKLALRMQDAPGGKRLVQISRREAAEFFAGEAAGSVEDNEAILVRETNDTGIISSVGNDVRFWHLSFQEYLAALEIAGLSDALQMERVVVSGKLYLPEWRETMRMFSAVLLKQGEGKVDGLFQAILDTLSAGSTLADRVERIALLGAMMRDLSRMKYSAKMSGFEPMVRSILPIFEVRESEGIELSKRIEAADLLGQVGDPRLDADNWITIPAGTFYMGARKKRGRNQDRQAYDEQAPVRAIELKQFRIRRFPVTVQEFGEFISAKGYATPRFWKAGGYGETDPPADWERQRQSPNHPIVGMNWFEAAAYCKWRGCRLPSEAEWERAARGPRSSRYPWGDGPPLDPSCVNYSEGSTDQTTPVGVYPKGNSMEGLSDVLGNVLEWCEDWYAAYDPADCKNPRGPKSGKWKILRGGSWGLNPLVARVSCRYRIAPEGRNHYIGFRCAGD